MSEWIVVTSCNTGKKMAIPTRNIAFVEENDRTDVYNGRRATIHLIDGSELVVYDSFNDIGEKIK